MTRACDAVVISGDPDALVAATVLAGAGAKVMVLAAEAELGGAFREIEFAPGFRAAPLAPDLGYVAPEVLRAAGLGHLVREAAREAPPAAGLAAVTSDPTIVALGDGEPLLIHRSVERAAEALKRLSPRDAQRWPEFVGRVDRLCGFLAELYRRPPPRIDGGTLEDFFALVSLGRRYRSLGRTEMIELLRTMPMPVADWLDDWFESEPLKGALAALAVTDVCQGPLSGGTAFTFLHRHVGAQRGVIGERLRLKAGPGALVGALEERARAAGVVIETDAAVHRLIVREGRIAGVRLASGEEIHCRLAISGLDPYRSLLELLDPVYLDPDLIHAIRHVRYRGVTTKVLLALDGLPDVPAGLSAESLAGSLLIAPSVRYVERAYDATKYGRCSDAPVVTIHFPSITRPGLAPAGRHVAILHVQFTPYRLRSSDEGGEGSWEEIRDRVADRAISLVERHIPGFTARILARSVLTPVDLEARFGLREGAVSQGEMMLDQILFMRPVPGWSRHAMPVPGLYLCGAGTHPGAGIAGLSGYLAGRSALAEWAGKGGMASRRETSPRSRMSLRSRTSSGSGTSAR